MSVTVTLHLVVYMMSLSQSISSGVFLSNSDRQAKTKQKENILFMKILYVKFGITCDYTNVYV